ncbi:hypothetical protein C8N29_10235 [Agitococcus lubricus]|uniref:Uncharacterized protein n=2 Tax=Agitococcus lubricus TaxID=1077255 RepID=A0A2T5J277_9GAMM|nr:hypothetical protein C8N29_10235 [Agitococcus lubricus]
MPYPARALQYQQALSQAQIDSAIKSSSKQLKGKDALLAHLEQGRLYQLAGNYALSEQQFKQALQQFDDLDQRATLSLSSGLEQSSALVSNDNLIPYQGNLFERIFAHQFQAFNYIAQGDKSAALVEMRRAQFFQDKARDKQAPPPPSELSNDANSTYQQRLGSTYELAQRVNSSTENAYSFYLAALLYEATGQLDDAYIDYKRALSIAPNNRFVQQDVARLATRLQRTDELKRFNLKPLTANLPANTGTVVVLYEEGFVPAKEEIFLPFPWPQSWYVLAFPYYKQAWQATEPLSFSLNHQSLDSQLLADTQSLAAYALKEQIPSLLVRQTLRAQTKHKLQQEANDKGGAVLGLLVSAYNILSENADLRSWLTLPRSCQVARIQLSAGQYPLTLSPTLNTSITVNPQQITLVRVVKTNNHVYVASWPL